MKAGIKHNREGEAAVFSPYPLEAAASCPAFRDMHHQATSHTLTHLQPCVHFLQGGMG